LYGLVTTLFIGFTISFIAVNGPYTTLNSLDNTDLISNNVNDIVDQKAHEILLNTLDDDPERTKEEAEDKIEDAEDKIDEVEDKIADAKTNGVASETIDEAEDELEAAHEDLTDAKDEFDAENYDEAYEKAEDCIKTCEDILDMLEDGEDGEDGENGDDGETGNGNHTKAEAEDKIEKAEDKIDEVEDKISEAKSNDVANETIDEAEDKLEAANEDLAEAEYELEAENYNEAYGKARSSIEKCEDALDLLEDGEDGGAEDDGTEDGEDNDTGNGDETGDESPEREEILLTVPEAIQAIETPQMFAFTAIGAIAVSNIIMLTNKRFALKFATLVVKFGDAFFAVSAVAYKVGGTLFVAIGAVLRPPSIRNIKQEEVLANDTREQIYSYICNHEGAHFREIIGHVAIGPFAGIWHLQVLEDFEFIVSRRHGHFKIFYPTGRKIPLQDPRLVLKNKTAKKVFRFILKHPGTYQNEIAKELGKSHGTIRYNLKKLVKAKLVDITTDNGRKKFFINDETLTDLRDLT
jgi:hypothetical protein